MAGNTRKIQRTNRESGPQHSIYLPEDALEQARLKKGDTLEITVIAVGELKLKKKNEVDV